LQSEQQRAALTEQLGQAKARQADYASQLASAFRNFNAGKVSERIYDSVRAELETAYAAAEQEVTHWEAELAEVSADQLRIEDLEGYCHAFSALMDAYGTSTAAEAFAIKQQIIRALVSEVWVSADGSITFKTEIPSLAEQESRAIVLQPLCLLSDQTGPYAWDR
jgi:hypothetical protein